MSAAILEPLTVRDMSRLFTLPYARGVEQFSIPIGPDGVNGTSIGSYDFTEYHARYGTDPAEPKYVLFLKNDVGRDPLTIEVDFSFQGANQTAVLKLPQRSFANTSFVVPLPADANASLRLLRFRQRPVPLSGNGADNFGLLALLGNLSKLLWVIGSEKDLIRQHLRDIRRQRQRSHAHDFSLDQLGQDLRVPRFPPREYSFDRDTIALYHLNDAVANGDPVLDETAKFGGAGHPGVNANAQSLAIGKFAAGFGFPGPNGDGAITIANHADFAISAGSGFTAEAFVNAGSSDAAIPRVILNKGQLNAAGTLTAAGWSLTVGSFRGIANNVRWSISDGNPPIDSFADLNLADGKFHHVAGVIDQFARLTRLFVDGVQHGSADITGLGALTNAELIRIGRSATGHSLTGVIDEVRFSRVARAEFQPVLGEGDDAYRRRLGIFERWLLPTHNALQQTINDLVQIDNQPDSFVLIESDRPSASASKPIRILPASLPAGKSIDREGNSLTPEFLVSGAASDEPDFNQIFLLNHNRPVVDYGADANNHLMQLPVKACLDELVDLLAAASPPIVGNLIVDRAFGPTAGGLHQVGRAVLLRHQNLALDQLGAMVHRAGFDFTQNLDPQIYASVAVGEKLEIVVETPPPASGVDLFSGQTIRIHVAPEALPTAGQIKWTLIANAAGRAHLQQYEEATLAAAINATATSITVASPIGFPVTTPFKIRIENEVFRVTAVAGNTWTVVRGVDGSTAAPHAVNAQITLADRTSLTTRSRLRLVAEAPGEITLRVEYTFRRQVVSGLRTIRIGIDSLADGLGIASDGTTPATEDSAVGTEHEAINPIYLVTSNVAGVDYGADPNNKKMQIVLERAFNSFLATEAGVATGLQVLKAFDPADTGLHKAGRALRLTHGTVTPDHVAALAHRAGFGFVLRQGTEIHCSVAAGEKIEIATAPGLTPLANELIVGLPVNLRVRLDPLPAGGSYNWSLSSIGHGTGSLDFVLRPAVKFTPQTPGFLGLNITYLEPDPDRTFPYTFEIRLKPSLEAANAVIPKDQFDLIMNILNFFHPIGVEIVTARIRQHVIEVEQDPQKAFPAYTYPDFRV